MKKVISSIIAPNQKFLSLGSLILRVLVGITMLSSWLSQVDVVLRIVCYFPGSYRFRKYFVIDFDYWSRSWMLLIRYCGSLYTISNNPVGIFYVGGYICCACQ